MDRNIYPKYYPKCPRNIALVDQYSWTNKDTNDYTCENGISHPIYDCNGWIQYSLPLDMYPPINDIHPQIKMIKKMHLNWRDSQQQLNDLAGYNPNSEIYIRPKHPQASNDIRKFEDKIENYRFQGFYGDPCGRS